MGIEALDHEPMRWPPGRAMSRLRPECTFPEASALLATDADVAESFQAPPQLRSQSRRSSDRSLRRVLHGEERRGSGRCSRSVRNGIFAAVALFVAGMLVVAVGPVAALGPHRRARSRQRWQIFGVDIFADLLGSGGGQRATTTTTSAAPPELRSQTFATKFSRGSCRSRGATPIASREECEQSAQQIGLPKRSATLTQELQRPEGCFYYIDLATGEESLWFNANPRNRNNGAETGSATKLREPLCLARRPSSGTAGRAAASAPSAVVAAEAPPAAASSWPQPGAGAGGKRALKAIGYAPVPLKAGEHSPHDDFMSEGAKALWSSSGCRRDLQVIKAMGANAVRLYGHDAELDHHGFLDEAQSEGLEVIAGLSDYPYIEMPGSCKTTSFDCFAQVKAQYGKTLRNGFLRDDGQYHPAIRMVVLVNEPDVKFHAELGPERFCKAVVSAFDAVLEAEREAGVFGDLPRFSSTFSNDVCRTCTSYRDRPALGQMDELRRCMERPEFAGYVPKNNVWAAYGTRFANSLNIGSLTADFVADFMSEYSVAFPGMPVFMGDYRTPASDQLFQLETMLQVATDEASLLMGLSVSEFQVQYGRGSSDKSAGLFDLGENSQGNVVLGGKAYPARCLTPQADTSSGELLPSNVARAFGGKGLDYFDLCSRRCSAQAAADLSARSGSAAVGAGSSSTVTAAPAPAASSATTTSSGTPRPPYDCSRELDTWSRSWPAGKKAWCCMNEQKGCGASALLAAPPKPPQPEFDCASEYMTWVASWSESKKLWCCTHQGVGCEAPDDSLYRLRRQQRRLRSAAAARR